MLKEARRRFDAFMADPTPQKEAGKAALPSEIAASVFKLVQSAGGEAEFDSLLAAYELCELNDDKKNMLMGLATAPTAALRRRALDFAMSDAVKLQDFFYVALVMHRKDTDGMLATWDFFKEQLPVLKAKLDKAGGSLMDACITGACSSFATADKAAEVKAFFADPENALPKNERKISQTLENINNNCNFLDAFKTSQALVWLSDRKPRLVEKS